MGRVRWAQALLVLAIMIAGCASEGFDGNDNDSTNTTTSTNTNTNSNTNSNSNANTNGNSNASTSLAATLPTGRIAQSSTYRVEGNLLGGAQAPEGSAFASATIMAGTGTSVILTDGQLVITGNVSASSGGVPFLITGNVTNSTEVRNVEMTIGIGTTFVGSGTTTPGFGEIRLLLSNGTTFNLLQEGITRTGNSATTLKVYDAAVPQNRCDGSTDSLTGPLMLALLPEGTFAMVMLLPANMVVATGSRTDTTLVLSSVNLANGNVGAGTATSPDGFATLSIGYGYCDSAGGCVCPRTRLSQTTATATRRTR